MKSLRTNFTFNLLQQLVIMATPLITSPYTARVLGAGQIGRASYVQSVAWYFVLAATLGSTVFAQREIASSCGNKNQISKIFWNAAVARGVTVLISVCSYFLIFAQRKTDSALYLIYSLEIIGVALDFSWLFYGTEDFKSVAIRNIFVRVLNIAFIFLFVKTQNHLLRYVLITVSTPVLGSVLLIPFIKKLVESPFKCAIFPGAFLKGSLVFFIPAAAVSVYTVLDKTMIGLITKRAEQNGWYELSFKLSRMGVMLVTSLGAVMSPRLAALFGSNKNDELKTLVYKSALFAWAFALPVSFGLSAISKNFIPWFLGNDFIPAAQILSIMSLIIIPVALSNVTGTQFLIGIKKEKIFTVTVLLGSAVNVISNAFLIPHFGAKGAAVASVIAESVIAISQLIFVRHELCVKKLLFGALPFLPAALIMYFTVTRASQKLKSTALSSLALIAMGAAVYLSIAFCFFKLSGQIKGKVFGFFKS